MIYFLKRWLKINNELFYIVKSAEKECGFIKILPFTVFQLDSIRHVILDYFSRNLKMSCQLL